MRKGENVVLHAVEKEDRRGKEIAFASPRIREETLYLLDEKKKIIPTEGM